MPRKKRSVTHDAVRLPVSGGGTTLVDRETARKLAGKRLSDGPHGYVRLWYEGRREFLHRLVCPCPPGKQVDHINRDKRDNRACNLRAVTPAVNRLNSSSVRSSSGWRGVHRDRSRLRARVRCCYGQAMVVGFHSALVAALCRDDLLRRVTGLRLGLNFPHAVKGADLRGFLQATRGKLFSVVFVRRSDGRPRRMVCRTGVARDQKGAALPFDPRRRDLLGVFDVRKRQYRFIPLENVLCLSYQQRRYRVVQPLKHAAA